MKFTELDWKAYQIYLDTPSDYTKMDIRDFFSFVEYRGYYYDLAKKQIRKIKLETIELEELIEDLKNLRTFSELEKNESKLVSIIIRLEKLNEINDGRAYFIRL